MDRTTENRTVGHQSASFPDGQGFLSQLQAIRFCYCGHVCAFVHEELGPAVDGLFKLARQIEQRATGQLLRAQLHHSDPSRHSGGNTGHQFVDSHHRAVGYQA